MPGIPLTEPYALPTADTLPDNQVRWRLDPRRAVLLVHDMQRFFVNALPAPLRAELVGNVARLRRRAARAGVPTAYTAQPGRMTPTDRGLLRDFWGEGMRSAPADRDVVPELAPAPGERVFTKWRYSAFFRSDLLAWLRATGRDQLVLCGVYAHVGLLATALDAFTHDIEPFVVADGVGDFSAADHRLALDYVARRCGAVLLADEVFA